MAILKNHKRSTSAIASSRCVLITLDKLEFLHLINYGPGGVPLSGPNGVLRDDDEELQAQLLKYVGKSTLTTYHLPYTIYHLPYTVCVLYMYCAVCAVCSAVY